MTPRNVTHLRIGQRKLALSNLDKVLYPRAGFTKGDVIDYCRRIAPVLLKHLKGRPVTLKRYPAGVTGKFFYEKNCPAHKPPWVATLRVRGTQSVINYCLVDHLATLLWVANLASLELHTLLWRQNHLGRPTAMVFDLDPGAPAGLIDCLPLALRLRDMLENMGLKCFGKTSGGKGFHVYVPLNTAVTFDQTKHFAHSLAQVLERAGPNKVTSVMRKDLRKEKVLVDWSQNDEHKTTVCVYSLRAKQRPAVSTPVTWLEVENALRRRDIERLTFEPEDVLRRVEEHGDLFAGVLNLRQKLPAV
ncbi:non-homologous end-joining DNA ligase [Fontivita pretiosa]|uniref:non-homologous end-joining DNA ligase n=1 Tax=Fontivita pretiosa TaxID=2989684 RepID=UPI003D167494